MLHKYVTPVAGNAVKVTVVLEHVNGPLLLAIAFGWVMSCATIVDAVAVQPLLLFVTVTVYVPGIVVVVVCVVALLLHKYVTPLAGNAVKVTVVFAHVNGPLLLAIAFGCEMSPLTIVEAVAVQPLLLFVMVTV